MTDSTKIALSPEELSLVTDPGFILTKNAIIEKVFTMYGDLSDWMRQELSPLGTAWHEVLDISPKISRGENYLGLPFVILDYPRYFRPHDVFAIRTMFWWGNFMSVTLHLKGNYREHYHQRIIAAYPALRNRNYYAGIGEDEWEHHFGSDNYISIDLIEPDEWEELFNARSFTKIAARFPLEDWFNLPGLLQAAYTELLGILKYE